MEESERCYAAALRILKYRFNSAADLRRKLRSKGFERDAIDAAVARLANEKWLDDARFAAAYVRTRGLSKKGKVRIRQELIRAGVADDVIASAVTENVDAEEERARALALAQRRLPILVRRYAPDVVRNKLTVYLLNQGYDAALVRSILEEIKVAHH
ncbi:MAG: regulatory protein RecX [Acidobacteriota bacterium]|nr:regulatory protein RecX [Acidobacteriota bacterium]